MIRLTPDFADGWGLAPKAKVISMEHCKTIRKRSASDLIRLAKSKMRVIHQSARTFTANEL